MTNHDANQSQPEHGTSIAEVKGLRFAYSTASQLEEQPPSEWVVKDVFPEKGVATIYGPSGAGKSFLLLDLMAAIAEGRDWHAHATKACRILCLVLEGQGGIRQRTLAWREHNGRPYPDQVIFMMKSFALNKDQDVSDLVKDIKAIGGFDMIVIDTLNRASPNADENSSATMSLLLSAAEKLQEAISGLVVLVHHTGKDATRGPRGHSSFYNNMDAAIELGRNGEDRYWKVSKVKDSEDGSIYSFKLQTVVLDEEVGTSSCVVIPGEGGAVTSEAGDTRKRMSKNQQAVYETIQVMLEEAAESFQDSPRMPDPYVELIELAERAKNKVTGGAKHSALRIKEALEWLESNEYIVGADGVYWIPVDA